MSGVLRDGLLIGTSNYTKMLADVICRGPEEACGLVAGQNGRAYQVNVVANALHSPTAYRMDPHEQIEAFLEMEKGGQQLLAIYHSHPTGPEVPSEVDRAEFAYPGVITLIWFPKDDTWDCRAYRINDRMVSEIALMLVDDE